MDQSQPPASFGRNIQDLTEDAIQLTVLEFREKHGDAFLIVFQSSGQSAERGKVSTQTAFTTASTELRVYPVRGGEFDLIDLGRTPNNDIVINDGTVSKCHAYFRRTPQGWTLIDAGSANGALLDDTRVPVRGERSAVLVAPGANLQFGSVRARFLEAVTLQEFVRMMARRAFGGKATPANIAARTKALTAS